MGEQVADALSMEDVAAAELYARVTAQLASEANVTEIILGCTVVLLTFRLEAGQAFRLMLESTARVLARFMHLLACSYLRWHHGSSRPNSTVAIRDVSCDA